MLEEDDTLTAKAASNKNENRSGLEICPGFCRLTGLANLEKWLVSLELMIILPAACSFISKRQIESPAAIAAIICIARPKLRF